MQFTGRTRAALTSVALLAALGAVTLSTPGPATAASAPGGTWGPSQPVTGIAALVPAGSTLVSSGVNALSCASPGNCVLVGNLITSGGTPSVATRALFIASEANGIVGTPELVPGLASLGTVNNVTYLQASCASAGECTVSGSVLDAQDNEQPFLVTETGGAWGPATAVVVTALGAAEQARLTQLSCLAPGDCTAVGYAVLPSGEVAFTLDETGGPWGTPQVLPASASAINSFPQSLSCASPGNCTVGGGYWEAGDPTDGQPFVATETGGTWGSLQEVPGIATLDVGNGAKSISVSCPDATDCTAVGAYTDASAAYRVYAADETGGTWGAAHELLLPGNNPIPSSHAPEVACWSAGNCTATGSYMSSPSIGHAFIASEVSGTWGVGAPLTNIPDTEGSFGTAVACTPGADCVVAGDWVTPRGNQPFAATVTDGSAGPAQDVLPATSTYATIALSCPRAGYCSVGESSSSTAAALANEASASVTTLKAVTTSPVYGSEQSDALTVTVTSPAGGTPTGTVTISNGAAKLCTVTLTNGAATCSLTATQLPPGPPSAVLTASYSGDVNYVGSASTPVTLIVARAPSATKVTFSPAALPYRSNGVFTFSVAVTSPTGTPAGTVDIWITNSHMVCQATLTGGKGSCTSGTAVVYPSLNPGNYQVHASYLGDGTHQPSASAVATLTITKPTTTAFTLSRTRVAYGQENLEKLSVKVSSALGGTPTGTVTIKAGSTVLCTIALNKGTGSCTLSAKRLRAGGYSLLARYGGSAAYAPSSVSKGLTITS
jgi:Bacterial Ig-like domain (group 3)